MAQASLDDKSLVLYLSFDEGKGNKAEDGSQYGHDGSFMVGARNPGIEFFTGIIDEVYLFNRVIDKNEMQEIMDGTFLPVQPADRVTTSWAHIKAKRD